METITSLLSQLTAHWFTQCDRTLLENGKILSIYCPNLLVCRAIRQSTEEIARAAYKQGIESLWIACPDEKDPLIFPCEFSQVITEVEANDSRC